MSEQNIFADATHVRLLRRIHLLAPATRAELKRRILIVVALGWVPLAALCLLQALFLRDSSMLSFFGDVAVHARLLISVPLLIIAEYSIRPHLEAIARHFVDAGLIPASDLPWFRELTASSQRLGASIWPSMGLGVVVYALVIILATHVHPEDVPTWQRSATGIGVSWAGWWHMLVSLPLLLGLVLAWVWRLGIWTRFLGKIAHKGLRLVAAHPDHSGGLEFLALSPRVFSPVVLAVSAIVAGTLTNKVIYAGFNPVQHAAVPAATVGILLAIFLSPPLIFSHAIKAEKIRGIFKYGMLAGHMGMQFEKKWLNPEHPVDADALAEPDFSSTTDLYSVASNVYAIKPALVNKQSVVALVVAGVLPFAPIWLSVVPLQVILKHVVGMLF
ncbi:hypothetical protein [Dyella sp. 20L07]|uniref:hypothetical protein n=1 Tax=Dyella sp. 20L07 TaxID=3384240 RepID=UPI003D28672D